MSRMVLFEVSASLLLLASILLTSVAGAQRTIPKAREIFAPYWTSEPGWDTELELKNNLTSGPLTVTPILRLTSGQEIPLSPVTIPSNASVSVWTNEGLLEHSPNLLNQPGSYGSVVFRFNSPASMGLHATVVPSIHGEPIAFSIPAYPTLRAVTKLNAQGTRSLEGIWWQPRPGLNDILVISNTSDRQVAGTLSLFDASGKHWSEALTLGSRQTERMAMSDILQKSTLSGNYGGISFESSNSIDVIEAVHFAYDESGKSSILFEIFRRDPNATLVGRASPDAKQWTLRAPMLALRNPDPALPIPPRTVLQPTILVRNTSAKTISADISLSWRGNSGKGVAKLPQLQLAPFSTREVQIGGMQKQLQIPDDAHWALVALTTNAPQTISSQSPPVEI
jgi:hypothetical protein